MDFGNSLPHSRYSPETAQLLVDYLKTLPEPAGGFLVFPHVPRTPVPASSVVNKNFRAAPKSARSEEGAALYSKFSCVACHATGDIGGWFGPRLDGVGARRDRAFIVAHITDAQAQARVASGKGEETSAKMPRFAIAPDEVNKIADYLLTIPDLK
jgi:mono/diheme cytochrome c family protein